MRARFNEDLLLWAIATLQPASVGDALQFINEIFPDVQPLPKINDLGSLIEEWRQLRYIERVHGKSRLYSVTYRGNEKLTKPLRHYRDKVRLFLLKAAHDARFEVSEGAQQGMDGDSPSEIGSSDIQEAAWPISSADAPRGPRHIVRTYWPRSIKQLDFRVGSEPRSPDTFLKYYSFPSISSIQKAGNREVSQNDLSISELGVAIGISPRLLTSFTHKPERHYRKFEIGKRGGGVRIIHSPKIFLKVVQYWLLDYFLYRLPIHESCHSYQKGKSILSNAIPHVNKAFVASIDVEDFFGSITNRMIQKLLRNNGYGEVLSHSISLLVTLDNVLPQGAPTSPIISNSYLFEFDGNLYSFCKANNLIYTRYADDITISGENHKKVTEAIGYAEEYLKKTGLRINKKKTRIASRGGQQKVTGVVVNVKAQPSRKFRRQVRAMFHQAQFKPELFKDRQNELRGYLSYLQSYPDLTDTLELKKYRKILEKIRNK